MSNPKTSVAFLLNAEPPDSPPQPRSTPASILGILPPELLSDIFSRLSFSRRDIAACRLVCRGFCNLSSPYLITYAVFSSRPPAFEKLQQVIDHPYFSRYVRELLCDFSSYQGSEDGQLNADDSLWDYVRACDHASRSFGPQKVPRGSELPLPPRAESSIQAQSLPGSWWCGQLSLAAYAHKLGHNEGRERYSQLRIDQSRAELDGYPERLLLRVLEKLVAVREITLGDFRSLTLSGESFDELCTRLFGNVLQPETNRGTSRGNAAFGFDSPCEKLILNTLGKLPEGRIHKISYGTHPFQGIRMVPLLDSDFTSLPEHIRILGKTSEVAAMGPSLESEVAESVFRSLRHLQYRFQPARQYAGVEEEDGKEEDERYALIVPLTLKRRLTAASKTLHSLVLVSCFVNHYGHPRLTALDDDKGDLNSLVLPLIMSGLEFPRLRKLDLRGFKLRLPSLKDFLVLHRSTLRELRLIDNTFHLEKYEGLSSLALWGGENLQLHSIEFCNFSDVDNLSRSEQDRIAFEIPPHYFQAVQLSDGEMEWPPEMLVKIHKAIEAMWLNWSRNMIETAYDCTHTLDVDYKERHWWQKPTFWTQCEASNRLTCRHNGQHVRERRRRAIGLAPFQRI